MRLITGKQCLVVQNNVFRKSHNLVRKREIKNEISIVQTVYVKKCSGNFYTLKTSQDIFKKIRTTQRSFFNKF